MQSFFIFGFAIVAIILHHRYERKQLIKSTMKQYAFDRATAEVFLGQKHEIMFRFREQLERIPCDEKTTYTIADFKLKCMKNSIGLLNRCATDSSSNTG